MRRKNAQFRSYPENFQKGPPLFIDYKINKSPAEKDSEFFSDALVTKCYLMLMKGKKKSCTNKQIKVNADYSDVVRICVLRSGLDGKGTADCILGH